MAFSQLELCNQALRVIHQLPITSIALTTDAAAVVLNSLWDAALEEFLSESFWNFAKTRDTLTAASPAPDFGWENRFLLPTNFVSLVGLNETYADTPSDLYEIEDGYILTDANNSSDPATVDLEYIYKPTDSQLATFLGKFDPKAVNAFVILLASKIAPALIKDGLATANALLQRYYEVDLPKARARNGNQNRPAPRFPYQTSTAHVQRRNFFNR